MRRLAPILVAIAALVPAAPAGAAARPCAGADRTPATAGLAEARHATLCLVNRERRARGLRPLRHNRRLRLAAARHSRDMVRRGFFAHVAPGGATWTDRIARVGYLRGARSWSLGENIAWGASARATPASIVAMWMRSPGHRANILSPAYREVGTGIALAARTADARTTYTQDFGRHR